MTETDEKLLIVFVDCSRDTQNVESVAAISCLVAVGCYLLVLILVILCSRKAIRPVIESMEKQKQFITDASRARESGGYGIGLSVAAAIVQAHKGKITAERTKDGICFRAVFPAK